MFDHDTEVKSTAWSFATWDLLSLTYWVLVCVHLKECNFQGTGLKLPLFVMADVLDL